LNFRQDLYIWEDVAFNIAVREVCKCYRFAMIKRKFSSGGCCAQIARSETPYLHCVAPDKLSADAIAAEALGILVRPGPQGTKRPRQSKSDQSLAIVPVTVDRDALDIEGDAEFTSAGAVCDEEGNLKNVFYEAFMQAFKHKEIALSNPAAPMGFQRSPGTRPGEAIPYLIRTWDDSHRHAKIAASRAAKSAEKGKGRKRNIDQVPETRWGAGWIASKTAAGKSRWFNIKKWGSWRLAFVLARLQRDVWVGRGFCAPRPVSAGEASSSSSGPKSSGVAASKVSAGEAKSAGKVFSKKNGKASNEEQQRRGPGRPPKRPLEVPMLTDGEPSAADAGVEKRGKEKKHKNEKNLKNLKKEKHDKLHKDKKGSIEKEVLALKDKHDGRDKKKRSEQDGPSSPKGNRADNDTVSPRSKSVAEMLGCQRQEKENDTTTDKKEGFGRALTLPELLKVRAQGAKGIPALPVPPTFSANDAPAKKPVPVKAPADDEDAEEID